VELEADLRVASDRLLATLDQLESLENEKRTLKPGSARFQTLAKEIERLASQVFAQTHAQEQLGVHARIVERRSGIELPPIEESTQARELPVVLAEWRDAERRLSLAVPDTAEYASAKADIARLRTEYHAAYSATAKDPAED
jgi:hypothetical protein